MSDTGEHPEGSLHTPERRLQPRLRVSSLAYIDLGEDNGGILLNIGEGGVAVQLAMPLLGDDLPQIRLQLPQSKNRIEISGEIAWVSESKKEAGIHFVRVPEDARNQIGEWISLESSSTEFQRGTDTVAEKGKQPPAIATTHHSKSPIAQDLTPGVRVEKRMAYSVLFPNADTNSHRPTTSVLAPVRAAQTPRPTGESEQTLREQIALSSVNLGAERWGWWALAVLTGALLAISFAIGVAIGHGALEKWPMKIEEMKQAKSEPAKGIEAAPANLIAAAPNPPQGNVPQTPVGNLPPQHLDSKVASKSGALNEPLGEISVGAAGKGSPSFTLNLPEEAVSASASVAISSRRSVPMPLGFVPQNPLRDTNLSVGKLAKHVGPVYPPAAERQHLEGIVRLHAVIGKDGRIRRLEPVSGPPLLVREAMNAVREWRYEPTLLDGQPIETREDIRLIFRVPN
jgi:TonB family protein